ncbi:hypothetical protein ACO2Q0_19960 [Phenylobacterium sp. VNQ135]|uniref:hypothetical protein n=1 Tax=Phenylobacterium sp. VNQ135 TaxID=3400922 RepID=UPI003C0B67DA
MRMRNGATLVVAVSAALALAACEGGQRNRTAAAGGDGLCKPFVGTAQAASPGLGVDGGLAVDDCLHRWGYTLAKADDDAGAVAQAVVAACSAPLARWNQQTLSNAAAMGGGQSMEAPSLLTGESTNPIAEHNNFADGRALFYVVQARAGKCDAPRARDDDDDRAAAPAQPAVVPNSPDR